ncbi:MAG: HD domain-containing phosphohydrolase [Thermoleophilia bacterium]
MKTEKARVLIVDDEETVREILRRTLSQEGYDCATACDVDTALELMEGDSIDLVISDIMMPGKSGIDLLGEVREKSPDTAMIMVTAVADTQTAINAMKLGAYDYVTKPFNLVEVLMSVDRAMEKRNLLITNREYKDDLEKKVQEQTEEIRETFLGAVMALAEALDAKDTYTNGHSKRVTEIAVTLATERGLASEAIDKIRFAGLVHDIGKIGVPEEILLKPGKLTNEEFDRIKEHSAAGEKILKPIIRDREILEMVRYHHERYSGGGYPEGRKKEDIPLGARIIAVADAFDAMTSNRPYREALSPEKARNQLLANKGSQFDPELVDLFIKAEENMPFCPISGSPGLNK